MVRCDVPDGQPQVLMCPPEYYGIRYEINAWMSRTRPADRDLAARQWEALRARIEDCGAKVATVAPAPDLPDMVFTANAALIFGRRAILSNFRPVERRGETPRYETWFAEHGFQTVRLPADVYFEGAGDALFCGDTLFTGYRIRSDARAHQQIAAELGVRVIPLELVDPYFYHLDTCFCPLAPGEALYYPPAFDEYARRVLREHIPRLIAASEESARAFGCNAVVIGRQVITNTGCGDLHQQLVEAGYTPRETPLGEFVKAGGSAKCLTLRLDGEEAAPKPVAAVAGPARHPAGQRTD